MKSEVPKVVPSDGFSGTPRGRLVAWLRKEATLDNSAKSGAGVEGLSDALISLWQRLTSAATVMRKAPIRVTVALLLAFALGISPAGLASASPDTTGATQVQVDPGLAVAEGEDVSVPDGYQTNAKSELFSSEFTPLEAPADDTNGDDTNGDDTNGDDTNGDDTNGDDNGGESSGPPGLGPDGQGPPGWRGGSMPPGLGPDGEGPP
ncbi:MAG: hypothetical protein JSV54_07455, partial [Chloroflexota bacterium]